MNMRDLVFLDCETTGLDPTYNESIEWAAIRETRDGQETTFEARVKPTYPERFHPKAMEVNGYTKEAWETAPPESAVAAGMAKICHNAILVAHNVAFDEGFLTAFLAKHGLKPSWHYHKVDTVGLAWPLYVKGELKSLSLSELCKWAGTSQPEPHKAMTDARCVQMVYHKLMARL
jgi:DNA polymerase-3 subunit alpha (Gram-positive type)